MFRYNKETMQIEEIKVPEVVEGEVDCIHCEGTGLIADVLEGDTKECLCITEGKEEEKATLIGESLVD